MKTMWFYVSTLLLVSSEIMACPDFCYCYEDFVTCSEFTDLDLTLLPDTAETLVLRQGEMEEIPPAFFARASNLKSVDLSNFNARVVRGGAFRGLSNLDSFTIKGSSFDIVEPDGFSGVSGIAKFLISDCHFGRVGKHAFAEITDVLDWRIWSNYFATISDEAFYANGRVHAIQLYQNNISFIGNDIFADAYEIEYVNFYMNTINIMSNGSLSHIESNADLLVVYANKFQCVCDNAWMTQEPSFEEYLTSNECFFASDFSLADSLFLLSDVNVDVLCPVTSSYRHQEVVTTSLETLPTLPSVLEEVEIWSDHGGLNPEFENVQENVYTGNVNVDNSQHGSEVNLTSEFDLSSSKNTSLMTPIGNSSTESILSSLPLDYHTSSSVDLKSKTYDDAPSASLTSVQHVSTESDSWTHLTGIEKNEVPSANDFSQPSSSFAVSVSNNVFSSLPSDTQDESSFVHAKENFKIEETTIQEIAILPVVDSVDISLTSILDGTLSSERDSMASDLLHGHSSTHAIEVEENVFSEPVSTQGLTLQNLSSSLLPDSSSSVSKPKPQSQVTYSKTIPTRPPTTEMMSEREAVPEMTLSPLATATLHVSSSFHMSTDEILFSPPSPRSSPGPSKLSDKYEEIIITSPSSEHSNEATADISNPENSKIPQGKEQKATLSLLKAITLKSSADAEPTATFPVELPIDYPDESRISVSRERSHNEKSQRDKQIYALPYSTSAVGMDTGSSASTVNKSSVFTLIHLTMTVLLSIYLLS